MESYGTSGACPKCGVYGTHHCPVFWETGTASPMTAAVEPRLAVTLPVTRAEFDALVARVAALEGKGEGKP
jgi:hypothetical protein